MSANATTRKDVRASILTNLREYLQTAAPNVQIGYDVANFPNSDVIVQLRDAGSERIQTKLGRVNAEEWAYFLIDTFVALNDNSDPVWSTAYVEDLLSDLEKYIADFLVDQMRVVGTYDNISAAGRTQVGAAALGSRKFRHEAIPIKARVIGG